MATGTYDLIASGTADGSSSVLTVTSIPTTYWDLSIFFRGFDLDSGDPDNSGFIRLNGDTGGSYASQSRLMRSSSSSPAQRDTGTGFKWWSIPANSGGSLNFRNELQIDIPNYNRTHMTGTNEIAMIGHMRTLRTPSSPSNGSALGWMIYQWDSPSSAITEISFHTGGQNWKSGTSCHVYGITNS